MMKPSMIMIKLFRDVPLLDEICDNTQVFSLNSPFIYIQIRFEYKT